MGRINFKLHPFRYPPELHVRRHGPAGYRHHREYRPWLEDEFTFRCIYCLKRQKWAPTDIWSVEHLIPQSEAPELECSYDNLVLACQWCNSRKLANRVPDPVAVAYGKCLQVDKTSAKVKPLNKDGEILERVLKLNHPNVVAMRRERIRTLEVMARCSPEDWKRLMGFPDELPNLRNLEPPDGNSRPQGIEGSWRERTRRPEVYEY